MCETNLRVWTLEAKKLFRDKYNKIIPPPPKKVFNLFL